MNALPAHLRNMTKITRDHFTNGTGLRDQIACDMANRKALEKPFRREVWLARNAHKA